MSANPRTEVRLKPDPGRAVRALLATTGVLVLAAALAPAALAGNGGFAPVPPESPNAERIHDTWVFVSIFIAAIFVLVEVLLVTFIWRYRRQRRERFEDGAQIHGATSIELMWTVAPVVILFLIGGFVFYKLPGIADVPSASASGEERLEVRVTGRQYYWQYEYPNGAVAIDTLRAPAGVPVRLEVTAPDEDVIHSWWIPALGGKIDAIPGVTNETWFQAERTGTYDGQCAELCGLEHANMLASVEVLPPAEFASWLEERDREPSEHRARRGGVAGRVRQVPRSRRRGRHRPADHRLAGPDRRRGARGDRPQRTR